jgi:hypothetical protein
MNFHFDSFGVVDDEYVLSDDNARGGGPDDVPVADGL